jgi:sugar lactone lactonase YvrE
MGTSLRGANGPPGRADWPERTIIDDGVSIIYRGGVVWRLGLALYARTASVKGWRLDQWRARLHASNGSVMPPLSLPRPDLAAPVGAQRGEGPVWDDRNNALVFVDIDACTMHRFFPGSGPLESFRLPARAASLALLESEWMLLAGRNLAVCQPDGSQYTAVSGAPIDPERVRFNDGKVDPWGRFVVGTMSLADRRPLGALYQMAPSGETSIILGQVTVSNGLGWTADRRRFYYVDSPTGRVDVFDSDPLTGRVAHRRVFVQLDEGDYGPDGLRVDQDDCVWIALWGGSAVHRYAPDGTLDGIVEVPASRVTSVAFGGDGLTDLYITTARAGMPTNGPHAELHAGDLFVLSTGTAGVPVPRFAYAWPTSA